MAADFRESATVSSVIPDAAKTRRPYVAPIVEVSCCLETLALACGEAADCGPFAQTPP